MEDWVDVGEAAALGEEASLTVEVDDSPVVVVRCGEQLYAVEDRCTHDGEPLGGAEVEDCQIICPRHGARFCLRTGDALTPPAYEPLRTFDVREHNGRILLKRS
ncbi:MAG TPA: non-heme iron oxygenase ferredoxin subunit [Steroidobacteraceae bacterium]|nr:non-heme iron oxygenase ferredoxin subunit [Steroidobacteraceae bacterium]